MSDRKHPNITYAVPTISDVYLMKKDNMHFLVDTRFPVNDSLGYKNIMGVNNPIVLKDLKNSGMELNKETFYTNWYASHRNDTRSIIGFGLEVAKEARRDTGKSLPLFKGGSDTIESIKAQIESDGVHPGVALRVFMEKVNSDEFKEPNLKAGQMDFVGMCDKFRTKYEGGDELWEEMMRNKKRVDEIPALGHMDFKDILDEDETVEEYVEYQKSCDPEGFGIYSSTMGGKECMFLATSGFEFIFMDKEAAASLPKKGIAKIESALEEDKGTEEGLQVDSVKP